MAKRSPKRTAAVVVAVVFVLLMLTVNPAPDELRDLPDAPEPTHAADSHDIEPDTRTGKVVETQKGEPQSTPWDNVMDAASAEPVDEKKAISNQNQWTDREIEDFKRRDRENTIIPLLPTEVEGVTIQIDGLSTDGKTIDLSVSVGNRTEDEARKIYLNFLNEHDDTGKNYHATLIP